MVPIQNPGFEISVSGNAPEDWTLTGNSQRISDTGKGINKAKEGQHWLKLAPQSKAAQVLNFPTTEKAYDRIFVSFTASSVQDDLSNNIRLRVSLYESAANKGWQGGRSISQIQITDLSNDNRADPNSYVDAYAVLKLGEDLSLDKKKTYWLVLENSQKAGGASAPVTIDNVEVNLAGPPPDQNKLPNILIVFQDDMGYGDASFQNLESRIQTVNLDKLASQGMRLTDAHSAATICGPSRVGLLTGTLPDKLGVHGNFVQGGKGRLGPPTLPEETPTLATLCRNAGYDTAVIGKWGIPSNWEMRVRNGETRELSAKNASDIVDFKKPLQNAEMFGFDYRYIYDESRPFLLGETAPYEDNPRPYGWHENGFAVRDILAHSEEELHASYLRTITDRAVRYIQVKSGLRHSDNNQFHIKNPESPFFVHYLTHAPHLPIVPAEQFKGMSKAGDYGDFVVNLDYSLGRLMQVLDDCGMADNTILVFSSDNGPEHYAYGRIQETGHYSMGDLRGIKRDLYEGGHRVPTVVRWPRVIKANSSSDAMVSMTDWYATVAAITGQRPDPSTGLDSANLLPVLTGNAEQVRSLLLQDSAVGANHRAIRSGDWVYIDAPSGEMNKQRETNWFRAELDVQDAEGNELYNLKTDPRQSRNRILSDPEQAEHLKKLMDKTWQPGVRSTPPFDQQDSVQLVKDGRITCAVVLPRNATELQQIAAEEFRSVIEQAAGDSLQVVTEGESTSNCVPIFVGPSRATKNLGYDGADLEPEQFRIIADKDFVIILAKDLPNKTRPERQSMVTAWAFAYLMDRYMGVVKLWPGELGTVVPKTRNLQLPKMDIREQPKLFYRSLRNTYDPELNLWNAFYQSAGSRETRAVMHSFRKGKNNGDWWGRFHEDKPEMLARGPDGKVGHAPGRPHFCKICISNPEVTDEIIRIWKAAGAPDYWDMTPNDGTKFCTCDGCRELDRKYGYVEYTREEIWDRPAHVDLTDRYVWFWNQLIRRMRETNPNIKIGVYFYSAYRNPPKKLKLEPGIFGAMVPVLDTKNWDAWIKAGASEIGLRPNWYYMGACGPSLHLHTMGNYIEHARENDMVMINMDSLYGFWATQGIKYYLTARLVQRYDLSTEDVIEEYCAAFGSAAKEIREYVDYWEAYDEKVAWNIPAGGMSSVNPDGLYETYCREEFGKVLHPLQGHWRTLSAIYNPKVMQSARNILDSAMAKTTDSLTRKRIEFLYAGLDHVEICAELVNATKAEKQMHVDRVTNFNQSMEETFGYWGTRELFMMQTFGLLGKEINIDDM